MDARGVLRFELDGCAARASKPLPIFKGDFGRKGYPFLKNFFLKNRPIFQKFLNFHHAKTRKFGLSQKSWPMFKDFLVKNGTHVWGFFVKRRHIPIRPNMWVPPTRVWMMRYAIHLPEILKGTSHDSIFQFSTFFPNFLIFLQFRDPSNVHVLNLSTKAVLQNCHN